MMRKAQHKIQIITKRTVLFFALVVSVVMFTSIGTVSAAGGSASYTIESSASSMKVGSGVTMDLFVTPSGASLLTGTLRLNFSANLQYQSFNSSGTPFSVSTTTGAPPVGASSVQIIYSYFPPASGASGTKLFIGKVSVNGISAGSGQVTVTNAEANEPNGDAMSVTTQNASFTVESVTQPPADTDGDGIPDSTDACPTVAEDKDGHDDGDGCPEEETTTPPTGGTTTKTKTTSKPAPSQVTSPSPTAPTESVIVPVENITKATSPKTTTTSTTTKKASGLSSPVIALISILALGATGAVIMLLRRRALFSTDSITKGADYRKIDTPSSPAGTNAPAVPTPEEKLLEKIPGPPTVPPGQTVKPKSPDDSIGNPLQ